jgi:hypothetical protein
MKENLFEKLMLIFGSAVGVLSIAVLLASVQLPF